MKSTSLSKVSDRFNGSECAFLTRKSTGLNQGDGSVPVAAGRDEPIHDFSQVAQPIKMIKVSTLRQSSAHFTPPLL